LRRLAFAGPSAAGNDKQYDPDPSGFKVQLKRKVPQEINPEILLLEKMVAAPTGIEPDHTVTIEVSFEEHTSVHYKEVEILLHRPP
jgi:hypothetical protein